MRGPMRRCSMWPTNLTHWVVCLLQIATSLSLFIGSFGGLGSGASAQGAKSPEREARELRVARAFRMEMKAFEKDGLVYKSPYFWQYFNEPDRMEALFQGRFELRGLLDEAYIGQVASAYVISKWNACRSTMGSNVLHYEITHTKTERRGGLTSTTIENQFIVGVEPRFLSHFEKRFNQKVPLADLVSSVRQLGEQWDLTKLPAEFFRGTLGKYINPSFDAAKFIRLTGCGTPPFVQFEENLLRRLNGQPAVRNIPGAFAASDTGFIDGRYASLGEACFMDGMFRGGNNADSNRILPYCACVERTLTAELPQADVVAYVSAYDRLEFNDQHYRKTFSCRR